jgi:hypothetical protein
MPVDADKVAKTWRTASPGDRQMYFFPSTSDIFYENAKDYVATCRKIIDAGHEVCRASSWFSRRRTLR